MKIFLITAVFALIAVMGVSGNSPIQLTEAHGEIVKKLVAECINQEKISQETASALHKCQFSNVEKNAKCFTNCVLSKAGVLVDGIPQASKIASVFAPNMDAKTKKAIMDKCNNLKGSNVCETAFELYTCYCKENALLV